MKKYHWVISDLDGTIILHNENGNIIYDEVIDSINNFINNGNIFTIATGRHYKDVISIIHSNKINFKSNFFIVGMNGGQIYSWGEKKLIYNSILPNDKMNEIKIIIDKLYKKYLNEIIIFGYGENENIYTIKSNGNKFDKMYKNIIMYEDNQDVFKYIILEKNQLLSLNNINKFCIGFMNIIENPKKLINELNKMSNDVEFIQTGPSFVEIMPKNINKGMAIQLINNNFYKINEENILALGDSGNDIEMLEYAGKSITRKCAPEYVKIKVTEVFDEGASLFVKAAIDKYGKEN